MDGVDARRGESGAPYEGGVVKSPRSWLQLWSIGRYDLRLTDDEWLDMTPRQFHALQQRNIAELQHREHLTGILATVTANHSLLRPDPPVTPDSFMIHKPPAAELDEPLEDQMDGDKLLRILGALPAGAAIQVDENNQP